MEASYLPCGAALNRGRYQILSVLGAGGFGVTYLAKDRTLDISVAVKEYFPNSMAFRDAEDTHALQTVKSAFVDSFEKGKARFLEEAQTLAKFRGKPGIVGVLDFFEENRTAYMVMHYLEGITLQDALRQYGVFPMDSLLPKMTPMMESLAEIHKAGLIHRDISPDNIMLTDQGKLVLIDFGAARIYDQADRAKLSVVLKPDYAPLEQFNKTGQGPWTDVYALCATIYHCVTGVKPTASTERAMGKPLKWPSALGVPIQPAQEAALKKGLELKSARRFQSVEELMQALQPGSEADPKKTKRLWAVLAGCAAMLLCGGLLLAKPWARQPETPAVPAEVSAPAEAEIPAPDAAAAITEIPEPCEFELYGREMTEEAFQTAVELLRGRLELLTGGVYSMEVSGDTVFLHLPKAAFCGYTYEDILRCYLSRAIELYAFDHSPQPLGSVAPHFHLDRSDLERVTLREGHLPGIDVSGMGIETETYQYIEIVLTEECAARNAESLQAWGDSLTFAQDIGSAEGFYYYTTYPSEDSRTFYLVNEDLGGSFSELTVYNLTHDPLPQSFTFRVIEQYLWETPEESHTPGRNQCLPEALDDETVSLIYEYYKQDADTPTMLEKEIALKGRFDALGHPYAYGKLENRPYTFVFQISADCMTEGLAQLLCASSAELYLQASLMELPLLSGYDAETVARTDGTYALCLQLNDKMQAALAQMIAVLPDGAAISLMWEESANSCVELCSVPAGEAVTDGSLIFENCPIAGLDAVTEENACLYRAAAYILNANDGISGVSLTQTTAALPSYEAERSIDGFQQAVWQFCPGAAVYAEGSSAVALLNLPVDEHLPEEGTRLAREIYEAADLRSSGFDSFILVLVQEDNAAIERGRIIFTKGYRQIYVTNTEPVSDGEIYVHGIFKNGRLDAYAGEFLRMVENDEFYLSLSEYEMLGARWDVNGE